MSSAQTSTDLVAVRFRKLGDDTYWDYEVLDRETGERLGKVRRRGGVSAGYWGAWEGRSVNGRAVYGDSRKDVARRMKRRSER